MRVHLQFTARLFCRLRSLSGSPLTPTTTALTRNLSVHIPKSRHEVSSPNGKHTKTNTVKLSGHIFSHGRQVATASYNVDKGWVEVNWADGSITQYPHLWLRDNCTCTSCFNPYSLSRKFTMAELDITTSPKEVQVNEDSGSVQVTWSDGHVSQFASDWLEGRSFTKEVQEERQNWMHPIQPKNWGAEMAETIPTFSFEQLMQDDHTLYHWITALEESGLALVKNAACKPDQLRLIGDRVAFLRRTSYGEKFTVKAKMDPSNLAYTPLKLGFHTDLCFYNYIPGMQMLHCIKQVPMKGGENQFADGFRIAMILKERHPDMFELLTSTPVDFVDIGIDHYKFLKLKQHPTIGLDRHGNVNQITFNNQVRDNFLDIPLEVVNKVMVALKTFNSIAYEQENHIQFKLRDGDIICFHNYRVLHGRSEYKVLEGGERHLEGAYIDWDELHSRRCVLLSELKLYE